MSEEFEKHRDHWHPWFEAALDYFPGREWTEIKRGSPEHDDWVRYFARFGWTPMVVRDPMQRAYTMPVRWPEQLPPGFPAAPARGPLGPISTEALKRRRESDALPEPPEAA
jgi:hypothetical protein